METSYSVGSPHDELLRDVYEGQGLDIHDEDSDTSSRGLSSQSSNRRRPSATPPSTPPLSPSRDFAPRGLARVRTWKHHVRNISLVGPAALKNVNLEEVQKLCSRAMGSKSKVDMDESNKFREQLIYIINSSGLLDAQPQFGPVSGGSLPFLDRAQTGQRVEIGGHIRSANGAIISVILAFGVAGFSRWVFVGGSLYITPKRVVTAVIIVGTVIFCFHLYLQLQWLLQMYDQTLAQANIFIQNSTEFDSTVGSAINFILEVELISRGYRLSMPMPPATRLENSGGQGLKSLKLRKALLHSLTTVIKSYHSTALVIHKFADQDSLRFYSEVKQSTPEQVQDEMRLFLDQNTEESQKVLSLRSYHQLAQETRKMFLLGLFCLDPRQGGLDSAQSVTVLESLQRCNEMTGTATQRVKEFLLADELFNEMLSPKTSPTPQNQNQNQWQDQLRKIGTLSMSVRSIQAKIALMTEESTEKSTNIDTMDTNSIATQLISHYDSIAQDIITLKKLCDEGRRAVATNIAKTEKRVSSIGSVLSPFSPTTTTTSDDGSVPDALHLFSGNSSSQDEPISPVSSSPPQDEMQVFEVVAGAGEKSRLLLPREARIQQMKEQREAKAQSKERADMRRAHLEELAEVVGKRPHSSVTSNPAYTPTARNRKSLPPRLSLPTSDSRPGVYELPSSTRLRPETLQGLLDKGIESRLAHGSSPRTSLGADGAIRIPLPRIPNTEHSTPSKSSMSRRSDSSITSPVTSMASPLSNPESARELDGVDSLEGFHDWNQQSKSRLSTGSNGIPRS